MNIDDMIEVLQAAKRGEKIEYRYIHADKNSLWMDNTSAGAFDFAHYDYRIAPKKEMTLVEEARRWATSDPNSLLSRLADRIEQLEEAQNAPLSLFTTDELIDEIKRRITN